MRAKLVRILVWAVALQTAAFRGGNKFPSSADSLKSGTAIASMGGIDLDLRDATLDPAGAELELSATMGGVQVTVRESWTPEPPDKPSHGRGHWFDPGLYCSGTGRSVRSSLQVNRHSPAREQTSSPDRGPPPPHRRPRLAAMSTAEKPRVVGGDRRKRGDTYVQVSGGDM